MNQLEFEKFLDAVCTQLTTEVLANPFQSSKIFEDRVRAVAQTKLPAKTLIDFDPHPQAFPDIAIGGFGIEVKFTSKRYLEKYRQQRIGTKSHTCGKKYLSSIWKNGWHS